MKTIVHTLQVHADAGAVYEVLTTGRGLAGWWTTQVQAEPGEGGTIRFTFEADFHAEMRQERLERDRAVHWRCVAGHPTGKTTPSRSG